VGLAEKSSRRLEEMLRAFGISVVEEKESKIGRDMSSSLEDLWLLVEGAV
jgi:hypothetical protein